MPQSKVWQASDIEGIRLPCWYELLLCDDPAGFILRVHRDIFRQNCPERLAELARPLSQSFNLGKINPDNMSSTPFGWGGSFTYCGNDNGFLKYNIPFPTVEIEAGICERCDGTGKDQWSDDCVCCSGKGKMTAHQWLEAYQTCASLSIFFNLAESCHKGAILANESHHRFQLMTFFAGMINHTGGQSFPFSGHFSADFVNWLIFHCNSENKENARSAMLNAWRKMFIAPPYENDFIITTEDNGWLTMQLSGDCFVYPSLQNSIAPDWGYSFTCHHVDSPAYQLILIAGLVSLWQSAKEFYKKLA